MWVVDVEDGIGVDFKCLLTVLPPECDEGVSTGLHEPFVGRHKLHISKNIALDALLIHNPVNILLELLFSQSVSFVLRVNFRVKYLIN